MRKEFADHIDAFIVIGKVEKISHPPPLEWQQDHDLPEKQLHLSEHRRSNHIPRLQEMQGLALQKKSIHHSWLVTSGRKDALPIFQKLNFLPGCSAWNYLEIACID